MKIRYWIYCILLLSVWSCSTDKTDKKTSYELRFIKEINNPEIACITNIVGDESGFYVGDWANCQIYKFNYNDSLETIFGGKGKGPGEFIRLTDIALDKQGNIWAVDQNLMRIQKFAPDGKYLSSFMTLGGTISSLGVRENGNIITNVLGHKYSFIEYDKDGNVVSEFGEAPNDKDFVLHGLKNMSKIYVSGPRVYIIPYNSPSIFEMTNNHLKAIYTSEIKNYRKISYTIDGNVAVIDRGSIVFSAMVVDSPFVYLVGGGGDKEKSKLGHYFYIYELPEWKLIDKIWPKRLEYSEEGYTFHKYKNFFYFAKVSENILYKFELVRI